MSSIFTLNIMFKDPRDSRDITDSLMLNYIRDDSWWTTSIYIGQSSGGDTQMIDTFSPTGIYLKEEGRSSVCAILYGIVSGSVTTNIGDTGKALLIYGVHGNYDRPINGTWQCMNIGQPPFWR